MKVLKGALIGDPVSYSISHEVYPLLFKEYKIDGEFEKIHLSKELLPSFFNDLPNLDFITVTMPHKEAAATYCDSFTKDAKAIGCVNYIAVKEGKLVGCNFDGRGALDVIEEEVRVDGKTVVVMGAGGSARAAIFEARARGAHVIVVNRTKEKAQMLAREFAVSYAEVVPREFDVLINATSVGMDPMDKRELVSSGVDFTKKVVLDMASRNGDCLLQKNVTKTNGIYLPGSLMFWALTRNGLDFIAEVLHS